MCGSGISLQWRTASGSGAAGRRCRTILWSACSGIRGLSSRSDLPCCCLSLPLCVCAGTCADRSDILLRLGQWLLVWQPILALQAGMRILRRTLLWRVSRTLLERESGLAWRQCGVSRLRCPLLIPRRSSHPGQYRNKAGFVVVSLFHLWHSLLPKKSRRAWIKQHWRPII